MTLPTVQEENSPIGPPATVQVKVGSRIYFHLFPLLLCPLVFSESSRNLSLLFRGIPYHPTAPGCGVFPALKLPLEIPVSSPLLHVHMFALAAY